jgi:hypothetical protein
MNLTLQEQKEYEILKEYQKSRTRWMSELEHDRLNFLFKKQMQNSCSNLHCTGYEGTDEEIYCPKCYSILFKII